MGTANRLAATPVALVFALLASGAAVLVLTGPRDRLPLARSEQQPPSEDAWPVTPSELDSLLRQIHPGTPRPIIERMFQTFPMTLPEPVDTADSRTVYRVRYRGMLLAPLPHLVTPDSETFIPGPHVVTLEFDCSCHGHPLSRVDIEPIPDQRPAR